MRKWDAAETNHRVGEEAESQQRPGAREASDRGSGRKKSKTKRGKHGWPDDPVFREAYERGQLIIRTR